MSGAELASIQAELSYLYRHVLAEITQSEAESRVQTLLTLSASCFPGAQPLTSLRQFLEAAAQHVEPNYLRSVVLALWGLPPYGGSRTVWRRQQLAAANWGDAHNRLTGDERRDLAVGNPVSANTIRSARYRLEFVTRFSYGIMAVSQQEQRAVVSAEPSPSTVESADAAQDDVDEDLWAEMYHYLDAVQSVLSVAITSWSDTLSWSPDGTGRNKSGGALESESLVRLTAIQEGLMSIRRRGTILRQLLGRELSLHRIHDAVTELDSWLVEYSEKLNSEPSGETIVAICHQLSEGEASFATLHYRRFFALSHAYDAWNDACDVVRAAWPAFVVDPMDADLKVKYENLDLRIDMAYFAVGEH